MVLALVVSACLTLTPQQETVAHHLNVDRRVHARTTLGTHWPAQAKAQAWAERLAREQRLYHSNLSDGFSGGWCALAENVGTGANVAEIQRAYMASPSHRSNILNPRWNGMGVGYAKDARGRAYTVQVFVQAC